MGSAMQSLYSANPPKKPPQVGPQSVQPGGAQLGAPPNRIAGQTPTFGQMQAQGQPRPAPPSGWYNYKPGGMQGQYGAQPFNPQAWNPTQTGTGAPRIGWTGQGGQAVTGGPGGHNYTYPGGRPFVTGQTDQGYHPVAPPTGVGLNGSGPPGTQYGSTPSATTQQQNTANQLGTATQNLLLNQLQNPNPLGAQSYQTQLQQAQTQLNEQYKQQQDQINSSLASRGVMNSSLAGGYLNDLNTAQGRQMASIAANLLPQEAQLGLEGTNSALANMLGYGNQQFNQALGTAGINLAQQNQQNQSLQQLLGLTSY